MADFRLVVPAGAEKTLVENMAKIADGINEAIPASLNAIASMIKQAVANEIADAGAFGSDWADSLHVDVDDTKGNMRISMYSDKDGFDLFANGGVVKGNPLLWIGLSGTDAEGIRAKDFPGGLFSVQPKNGHPLLFSIADKKPKYFGIESVTIPQKFRIDQAVESVMGNFQQAFSNEMSDFNGS